VYEHFTDGARRVLVLAQEESRLLNHAFIGTEHILAGLINEDEGIAARTLASLGVTLEDVRDQIQMQIGNGTKPPTGSPPFTTRAKHVLEQALDEATQLESKRLGTEHLLLGLLDESDGVAAQVLQGLGKSLPAIREEVLKRIEADEVTDAVTEVTVGVEAPNTPVLLDEALSQPRGRKLVRSGAPILVVVAILVIGTLVARRRGYTFGRNVIVRCREGHLFSTIWIPGASLKAIRFGWTRFQRCPVGRHWSFVTPVKPADLSETERDAAYEHHDVRVF
jgi:hypothetical protein